MGTLECAPGSKWDSLVKSCVSGQQPITTTRAVLVVGVTPGSGSDHPWSSGMWICVCIVLIGSIIIVLLCLIVYIHHTHTKGQRNPKPPASHRNGTATSLGSAPEHRDEFPIIDGLVQGVALCEMDCGAGWGLCKASSEHVIPLPATELGDSALVTTKTVQPVDCLYSKTP